MPSMPPRGPMQQNAEPDEPDSDDMDGGEVCVPLAALSQPDDKDTLQTPKVGDSGTMTVDFTVTKIDGDNAYVKPSAVNGTAVGEDAGSAEDSTQADDVGSPEGDAAEGADLRSQMTGKTM